MVTMASFENFLSLSLLSLLAAATVSGASGPGGWKETDPQDDRVRTVAMTAVQQYERMTNYAYTSQLIQIRKAQTQIVAGVNYHLVLDIGFTNCRKNEVPRQSSCQITQRQTCKFIVWDQPWLQKIQITHVECDSVGAADDGSANDVKEAALSAVAHLQSFANDMYLMHLRRILDATKETEAGVMHVLKIECVVDSCTSTGRMRDCKTGFRNETVICFVNVRDQESKNPRHIVESYRCNNPEAVDNGYAPKAKSYQVIANLKAFEDFKDRYNKEYKTDLEENLRFNVFEKNLDTIRFLQDHELGTATYGATQFADLTPDEFRKQHLTPYWDKKEDPRLVKAQIPAVNLPTEYDWRHFNAVTPVKNQGSCGSCWAFSVTGNIEGQWALQKKNLISVSEQELVDCDKLDEGCNGGLPSNAYQEIQRLGGLETESAYPYKGSDDKCHLVQGDIRVYINGSLNISKDENEMAAWIYKNGPASIGINAFAMQFYFGGVSHPWKIFCSPDDLDHGVLIVGYGIKNGLFGETPYWIVKNSWGSYWGEQGYYLVYRGDGTCGLNQMVSSAIVK